MLNRRNMGGVRARGTSFGASLRRTVTRIPTPYSRVGNGIVSYIGANCVLGRGIVHRSRITIKLWSKGDVTGHSCCRILNISGATSSSRVGGTCGGVTVGCRPSQGPSSGRTRTGFGRTTRTCSILHSPRGHTHCSRFKRSTINNTKNFNNNNVGVSSVFSVFNSVFKNRKKFNNFNKNNKETHGPRCQNKSLELGIGVGLRRVSAKMAGGFGIGGGIAYARYRKDNTRKDNTARSYPAYRNGNCMVGARRDVFNVVRARTIYPAYNKRKAVVGGGYGTYGNRNVAGKRRIVRIGVPTNMNSNVMIGIDNGNRTTHHGNIPKSVRICVRRRPGGRLLERSGGLVFGLLLSIPATTLNKSTRVPAVSKGMGVGVRPNARPNGIMQLENGKLPTIRNCKCNGKSLVMGVDVCVPRALDGRREGTLRRVGGDSGFAPDASVGSGVFGGFEDCFRWGLR